MRNLECVFQNLTKSFIRSGSRRWRLDLLSWVVLGPPGGLDVCPVVMAAGRSSRTSGLKSPERGIVLSGVSAQNGLHHLRWRPRQQVHQGWKSRGLEIPLKLWGAPCFSGMYGCQSTPHRTFHLVVSGLELSIRSLSFMQSHNPHDLLIVLNTVMYWSMFSPDSWFRLLNLKRSKNSLLSPRNCEPSFSRMTLHFLLSVSLENFMPL